MPRLALTSDFELEVLLPPVLEVLESQTCTIRPTVLRNSGVELHMVSQLGSVFPVLGCRSCLSVALSCPFIPHLLSSSSVDGVLPVSWVHRCSVLSLRV